MKKAVKQAAVWLIALLLLPPAGVRAERHIVLLMDNSGSMRKNDPGYWSKSSAEFFIGRCGKTDRVTIIPFDSSLRRNRPLVSVSPLKDREKISRFIKEMDYRGPWTDYHWALKAAYDQLKNKQGDKFVILFTDGLPDPDPQDPAYKGSENKARKNRRLSMELIKERYVSEGIRLLAIAFTGNSDIDFLKKISYETNKSYDFCFKVDNSYGLSEVFLKISHFIPNLSNSLHTGVYVPPSLSQTFLLVNLNENFSRRQYINQQILELTGELAEREGRKKIGIAPYRWPGLSDAGNLKEVVRQLSKAQKFFIILDFRNNGTTARYYIYDLTDTRKGLYAHKEITRGILSELCGRIAVNIYRDLKGHKVRRDMTVPVTVKYLSTGKPAVAEVAFTQSGEKFSEYTDAFGHAIFVGNADEPFKLTFFSGGLKLGEWTDKEYKGDKVFYLAAGYDLSVRIMATPPGYDDLDPGNPGSPKKEVIAQIEVETLNDTITGKTPCIIREVPLGLRKLIVVTPLLLKDGEDEIPANAYLPYVKYIDVTPHRAKAETGRMEETITLDKDYLTSIRKVLNQGESELAKQKIKRLIAYHRDHPQVFRIFSLVSRSYRLHKKYREALDILVYFQKKYRDKYYYRDSRRLLKDRFLLNLEIAELRLIDYLKAGLSGRLSQLGLSDLRRAAGFMNQCQNSLVPEQKIESRRALEFHLYYGLSEFAAFRSTEDSTGKEWRHHFSQYQRILSKGRYGENIEDRLLDSSPLKKLFAEAKSSYKG
ncbi:MAG: VWA domain-containing protein [bacterium]